MSVSPKNRSLAKYLITVFGGRPSIVRYWDDDHRSSVDILSATGCPQAGVTTCATLGLSDTSLGIEIDGLPIRAELVMALGSTFTEGPNILATCAFNVIDSAMTLKPGAIFPRVIELYRPGALQHILFATPFLWRLERQPFADCTVLWLQAIPISDAEFAFAREHGSPALEKVFEREQIDVFNLDRPSVV